MCRLQLEAVFVKGLRRRDIAVTEKIVECSVIDLQSFGCTGDFDRFQFGGESEALAVVIIVKRLDSRPVAVEF